MPIINVYLLEGRAPERKVQLIRNITTTVVETLAVPPETVRVILTEMKKEEYGIGGKTAAELDR
jgi:4-oxalocrotonate tautomerase